MLSKNQLKYYSSLLTKKYRKKEQKFLVEGKRLVEEGVKSKFKLETIIVSYEFSKRENDYIKKLSDSHPIEIVNQIEFNKLSDTKNPQGIAAVFMQPRPMKMGETENELFIGLENISEPGNLGAILRNCDWFGFMTVFLSPGCAEIYNPKTLRASMGAMFHLNIVSENFYENITYLKNRGESVFAADMKGKDIYKAEIPNGIIIFSNEADGPSDKLKKIITGSLTIPKFGKIESLNVASASAVILSEAAKRINLDKNLA